ncbi:DUF2213 domain-containing protein [Lactobacillus crispatus]|uniref:DUF2213 domain-containing protein n=1 Tax=Lactobacillus crispatus TaxID=47770 RepID=UPI0018C310FF|nr:DUF2213 domain-containing protein [Lactobacillus crispatus]MBG0734593.1 DUF2213 domain-containing protein [Lactobacillus crispatus]
MNLTRYDTATINKFSVDSQTGFLHVSNVPIARVGVFPYIGKSGQITMEAKLPDDLLTDSAVESANSKPVTDDHPQESVNVTNTNRYMKGLTASNAHVDGDKLKVDMIITDSALIKEIQGGKQELSIGFQTDVVPVKGTFKGMAYDSAQKNIQINHVAVVKRGRAGHSVRLTGDSAEMVIDDSQEKGTSMETTKIRLDGADVTVATTDAERILKLDAGNKANNSKIAKLDAQIKALTAERDKLKGGADANKKSLDEAQAKADSLEKELAAEKKKFEGDALDQAIADRMALIDEVKPYVGDSFDFKGKSPKEMKLEAISKTDSVDLSAKSDDYIDAYFDSIKNRNNSGVVGYTGIETNVKTDSVDNKPAKDRYHLA